MELALVCSRLWGVAAPGRWRQVQAAVRDQLVSYGCAPHTRSMAEGRGQANDGCKKHTPLSKPEMATIPRQLIIVEMHRGLASGVGRTRRDDGWVSVWWW